MTETGILTGGVGGLYTVETADGRRLSCRAKGAFRHEKIAPLVGDRVSVTGEGEELLLSGIAPRKNALLRPAMANLDVLFFVIAAREPDPSLRFLDKMLSILVYNNIEPVLVVTKCDLENAVPAEERRAEKLKTKYEKCGFRVIMTDNETKRGDASLLDVMKDFTPETVAAFSGVSGAGKSTLLNRLFPALSLETGAIAEKIARGKHTTRAVALYSLSALSGGTLAGYLADTPGFSMLDFERFDFFSLEELPYTFREFRPYLGACRYTKCTHTKEEGCAVLAAVAEKKIPKSRHTSYAELYGELYRKERNRYD